MRLLYLLFLSRVFATSSGASVDGILYSLGNRTIWNPPVNEKTVAITVKFINYHSLPAQICWVNQELVVLENCWTLNSNTQMQVNSYVGHGWRVSFANGEGGDFVFEIVGGKHKYDLRQLLEQDKDPFPWAKIAQVSGLDNSCEDVDRTGWATSGPTWRDAVRRASYRRKLALCFCGQYNKSTSFTYDNPNEELPVILYRGNAGCDCDKPIKQRTFDYWFPCGFHAGDSRVLAEATNCSVIQMNSAMKPLDQIRIGILHSTINVDRLSMKQKLWTSLKSVLGFDDASLVMPASFDTRIADQNQQFHDFCHKVVERVMELKGSPAAMAASTLILKNSELHRQKGITIRSAQSILDHGIDPGFTFATVFLTNPFLVKKHKINVRRYLVAVCTGGRLRAYVHDDGKSIYTKVPYQEPWNIAMSPDQRWDDLSLGSEVMQNRLDEMITTGYVDDSMYDDKPLSVRDFLQYLRDRNIDTSLLQKSMFIRLALSVYVSVADEGFDLCAMHKDELNPPNTNLPFHLTAQPVPECLQQSIRFQHFGCDFHIDESLTGANAKLFECNKGPDFSIHSYKDGKMKRDVAADIASFIGFKGTFDGSHRAAKKHGLTLIFDSESFDAERAVAYLRELQNKEEKRFSHNEL